MRRAQAYIPPFPPPNRYDLATGGGGKKKKNRISYHFVLWHFYGYTYFIIEFLKNKETNQVYGKPRGSPATTEQLSTTPSTAQRDFRRYSPLSRVAPGILSRVDSLSRYCGGNLHSNLMVCFLQSRVFGLCLCSVVVTSGRVKIIGSPRSFIREVFK